MNTILAWIAIFIARWFTRPLSTPAVAILTHAWEQTEAAREAHTRPPELSRPPIQHQHQRPGRQHPGPARQYFARLENAAPPAVLHDAVTTPFVRPRTRSKRLSILIENVVCALLLAAVLALAVLWPSQ